MLVVFLLVAPLNLEKEVSEGALEVVGGGGLDGSGGGLVGGGGEVGRGGGPLLITGAIP